MKIIFVPVLFLLVGSLNAWANDKFTDVNIVTQKVAHSIYMLTGYGGNIGVSVGGDGILIIDDQFAPLADKISAALANLGNAKLRYIINTHYHGDHAGGNAAMVNQHNATIFAHDNVRIRLQQKPEQPVHSLPVVTYTDGLKFHFNQETIHVKHSSSAHTDGDSYIWFEQQNVVHMGDLMFNNMFPYIDLSGGGSVDGYIAGVKAILAQINDNTKLIPGHGKLATKADLIRYLNMITTTRAIVQKHKTAGKSVEETVATGLGNEWKSWAWQFINEEKWIRTLY